ncbi:MAG: sulfatase [Elusimicrobia bacterium]|nr:sulfatase [Elusimicrobiota bacterium]
MTAVPIRSRAVPTLRALAAACALLALALCRGEAQSTGGGPPLNVLVIDICSARADHFGAYGYPKPTTPGMDAVAKESVVFERAVAQSSWCMGNYASLFTGQGPEAHGLYAMAPRRLPDSLPTLAEKLKEAGYDTAAYSGGGTWLLPAWGMNRGFDAYEDIVSSRNTLTPLSERMPRILDWVRSRGVGSQRPFFLYVSVEDLHLDDKPEEPEAVWNSSPDDEPDSVDLGAGTARVSLLRASDGKTPKTELPSPAPGASAAHSAGPRPDMVAKYDGSLTRADRHISNFLQRIRDMGLWDKTVVIIAADHGDQLGEHGLVGHMTGLYEPVLHVPLIIRHPGFPQWSGKRVGELVERVDLMPTVLDIAGAPYEGLELPGRSLLDLLRVPGRPWREYAFSASKRSGSGLSAGGHMAADFILDERVVRTKRWKLHWYLHKGRFELYDLENDPKEKIDLSGRRPDIVGRLSFELLKRLELSRPHAPGLPSGKESLKQGALVPASPD